MSLSLNNINEALDSKLFFEFMKVSYFHFKIFTIPKTFQKNAAPQASIKLKFCDAEVGDHFRMDVEEALKSWETGIAKPKFRCDGLFNNVM